MGGGYAETSIPRSITRCQYMSCLSCPASLLHRFKIKTTHQPRLPNSNPDPHSSDSVTEKVCPRNQHLKHTHLHHLLLGQRFSEHIGSQFGISRRADAIRFLHRIGNLVELLRLFSYQWVRRNINDITLLADYDSGAMFRSLGGFFTVFRSSGLQTQIHMEHPKPVV